MKIHDNFSLIFFYSQIVTWIRNTVISSEHLCFQSVWGVSIGFEKVHNLMSSRFESLMILAKERTPTNLSNLRRDKKICSIFMHITSFNQKDFYKKLLLEIERSIIIPVAIQGWKILSDFKPNFISNSLCSNAPINVCHSKKFVIFWVNCFQNERKRVEFEKWL